MKRNNRKLLLYFDRILSSSLWKQGLILFVFMLMAFGISYAMLSLSGSQWQVFCSANGLSKWTLPLYLLIDTNALNNLYIFNSESGVNINGWTLVISVLTYLVGVFLFSGMIISLITNSISRRVDDHRSGRIFYLLSNHYVIMGYDDMVPAIIADIFARNKNAYVLLLTAVNAEKIKEWLAKSVASKQMKRIIVNYGHRTMEECYPKIHLENAEEIFIVGRREIETHDAMNVENVDSICNYLQNLKSKKGNIRLPKRITCVFEDLDTYTAFKTTEIFSEVRELGIELVPYNFYTGWAKQVFVKGCHIDKRNPDSPIKYPPLLREGEDEERYVHLVFVGITNCSVPMAIEAAHVLHYHRYSDNSMRRTRITFIDRNAEEEMEQFVTRYHHFFSVQPPVYEDLSDRNIKSCDDDEPRSIPESDESGFLDVEFRFIKGDIFSKRVQDRLCRYSLDPTQSLSIFLAMRNPKDNFEIGMNLPDTIYFRSIPIYIRQDRSDNFVTNLRYQDQKFCKEYCYIDAFGKLNVTKRHGRYANIYPFGMIDTGYSSDAKSLARARLVNYLYSNDMPSSSALCALSSENIIDEACQKWNELTVALKWSNLYSAYSIRIKLDILRRMRGLSPDDDSHDTDPLSKNEIDVLAEVEHNRWNVEKLLMGYSKAKPEEDKYNHEEYAGKLAANKKVYIHHDIRPYKKLGSVRKYDIGITANIPWLLEMTDSEL